MTDLGVGLVGSAGRMGCTLVRRIAATDGCRLVAANEQPGHDALGRDAGEVAGVGALGVAIADNSRALFDAADVVIEFSSPAATVAHAMLAAETGTAHVIGTTGLNDDQAGEVAAAATKVPIVWAPNMSVGVNILLAMTKQVAGILGDDYDIEIVEMHHRHKIDAPSGTALGLGKAAAAGRGVDLDAVAARGRDGITGARNAGDIGFAVLRGGDVVGDHTVVFAADGERLEIGHKASSRDVFANGAVRAALWTRGRAAGLYGMADVLGL
ncbi:MAG: 4-hydroxy-tetrahydrodipicolinate reductase [Alphaproteobacteria bacterium]